MDEQNRTQLIDLIVHRQSLKNMSRISRLIHDPLRALPFYILATLSHIKPYKLSFKTPWGKKMICFMPDGNTFLYYGFCEANLTSFLLRFLKPGMIFFDVGSHVGYYSMLASVLTATDNKNLTRSPINIHSFEPTPSTYTLLKDNTSELKNVKINNVALSDKAGQITFADYGPGYGAYNTANENGASISRSHIDMNIQAITLDQYASENKVVADFIKIDAEGLEYNILKGMQNIGRPLITLEMANEDIWKENCRLSTELLLSRSYTAYEMFDNGFIRPHEKHDAYTYTNILFVPNEKVSLVKYLIK